MQALADSALKHNKNRPYIAFYNKKVGLICYMLHIFRIFTKEIRLDMSLYEKTNNILLQDIVAKLKELRIEQNLTQKVLHSRSGVSIRRISDVEAGKNITILVLIQILRALNSLDYLSSFFEEKKISPIEYAKLMDLQKKKQRAKNTKTKENKEEDSEW